MRLIIGGAHQGKRNYALSETGYDWTQASDSPLLPQPIVFDLHLIVRNYMEQKIPIDSLLLPLCQKEIVICDEIGCGIVPIDAFEREWREQVGRLCQLLAQRAVRVDRIFCGLVRTIKMETELEHNV